MHDEINRGIDNDEDSNVDADTSLVDLDVSKLNSINDNISNWRMRFNDANTPSLFPYNNLVRQTADNMAIAEALVDEKPLRTEKTAELERREAEDKEEYQYKIHIRNRLLKQSIFMLLK
jgi:hypothetical protein